MTATPCSPRSAPLEALEAVGAPHGRVLVLIEASEESGSPDLEAHLDALAGRIGPLGLVLSLDSGCASYDRLWLTTSLRGTINAILRVDVMTKGVHSGMSGGVVPSSFRIVRELLERVEEAATGKVLVAGCDVGVPPSRQREIEQVAAEFGDDAVGCFPVLPGVELEGTDAASRLARLSWRAALEVTGAAGLPPDRSRRQRAPPVERRSSSPCGPHLPPTPSRWPRRCGGR